MNTDGAIFDKMWCCGVGVVVRNERGEIMGAMSKKFELPFRVLEVETKAVEEGVVFAGDLGLKDIFIESDAQLVVQSLGKQSIPPSSIRLVVNGIWEGLKFFNAWELSHVRRGGNKSCSHLG